MLVRLAVMPVHGLERVVPVPSVRAARRSSIRVPAAHPSRQWAVPPSPVRVARVARVARPLLAGWSLVQEVPAVLAQGLLVEEAERPAAAAGWRGVARREC